MAARGALMRRLWACLAVLVAAGCQLLAAQEAEQGHLADFLRIFAQERAAMEPEQRALAELFGARVGANRRYRYELKLVDVLHPEIELGALESFLEHFQQLRETGDMDALLEAIEFAAPEVGARELESAARVAELAEARVAPACRALVLALMRPLFDSEPLRAAASSGQLAAELRQASNSREARDFLFGWAHYHACYLLVMASADQNAAFYAKTARRASAYARVKARLASN